jgi:hypothetical protein
MHMPVKSYSEHDKLREQAQEEHMPSKVTPRTARRPSRVGSGEPAAAKRAGATSKGERSTATRKKDVLVAAKPVLLLTFHCFTKYVKVAFFRGTSLRPLPPGESRTQGTRYLDIHEDDPLDQELVASWIKQASELPGWVP